MATHEINFGDGFLTGKASVFVELENVLLYTDGMCLWLLYQLMERGMEKHRANVWLDTFSSLLDTCRSLPPFPSKDWTEFPPMYIASQDKQEFNPLLDFVDFKKAKERGLDPIRYCNDTYHWLWKQLCDDTFNNVPIVPTGVARGLQVLAGDELLKQICIYSSLPLGPMKDTMYQYFKSPQKMIFIDGDLSYHMRTSTCNTFFIQNVESLQYLEISHSHRVDVYLLSYKFNVLNNPQDVKDEYKIDKTIILPNLTTIEEYQDRYNVYINIIQVPI